MKYPHQLPILLFLTNVLLLNTILSIKCFQAMPFSGTVFPPASVLPTRGKPGLIRGVQQCQVMAVPQGQQGHTGKLEHTQPAEDTLQGIP